MKNRMQIDHIGIVVLSLEEAVHHWEQVFGYKQYTRKVENTRQKVYVVFLKKEGSLPVKLLEPADKTSPIYRFAKRGGGLHHLCFKCDDLNKEVIRMEELGLRILTPLNRVRLLPMRILLLFLLNRDSISNSLIRISVPVS
ncbi:MAG: VOC family protein [Candidatus Electrothrix sp. GW3-4]|uniref:VOC family protein n=1 Tax=Candidatus Electrothrix sp. GW3-4 TaxID=3126740 RepID=UPI0030CE1F4D